MPAITQKQERILEALLEVAAGNLKLLEEALRQAGANPDSVNLEDVVKYIVTKKAEQKSDLAPVV